MSSQSLFLRKLQENGKKMTLLRRGLAAVFSESDTPLSPRSLLARLARRGIKPHKTSIYRELDSLLGQRVIQEVVFEDGQPRYERVPEGHAHHIVCLDCKKVSRIELTDDFTEQERRIRKLARFKVVRHALSFYGLCAGCQK